MAADEVTLGNLALSFLGDEASLSALSPPEGSAQGDHIEQFYPMARDALLEMYAWPFALRRSTLGLRSETVNGWQYSYDRPAECLKVLAVLPQSAGDDYSIGYSAGNGASYTDRGIVTNPQPNAHGSYQPAKFSTEIASNGDQRILTNMPEADARWIKKITDTTKFSPLFDIACAKLLASFAAGPIYKGEAGVQMSATMMQHFQLFFNQSIVLGQGSEGHEDVDQIVSHLAGR